MGSGMISSIVFQSYSQISTPVETTRDAINALSLLASIVNEVTVLSMFSVSTVIGNVVSETTPE